MRNKIIILIILFIFIPVFHIYASGDKIICPVCGAENPKDAKFCWKCGAVLNQTIKKKEVVKKKVSPIIVPTDSILQTLKEIKDLLKDIKEELRNPNVFMRLYNASEDTLLKSKITEAQWNPVEKNTKKKWNNAKIVGFSAGCLMAYLIVLLLL